MEQGLPAPPVYHMIYNKTRGPHTIDTLHGRYFRIGLRPFLAIKLIEPNFLLDFLNGPQLPLRSTSPFDVNADIETDDLISGQVILIASIFRMQKPLN